MPTKPENITFDEAILILSRIFYSICDTTLSKKGTTIVIYAGIVNRECERLKLNELTADNFKYLTFVQGLMAESDLEIQSHILSKLEANSKLTLQAVAEEYE